MKKVTFIAFLLMLCIPFIAEAQKKDKKEKKKKEVVWTPPEKLSGDKDLDDYILSCDTIWNRMQTYRDSVRLFKIDTVQIHDKETNTYYNALKLRDDEGVERGFSSVLLQSLELTSSGISIIGDAAIINLKAVSASAALVANPLLAFSYGKYLKTGPQIAGMAYNEFKTIVEAKKEESRIIKELKAKQAERSTDTTILVEISENEVNDLAELIDINEYDLGDNANAVSVPEELLEFDLEIPDGDS